MSDNKNARKKLEQMERARRMDEERRERIKAQRQRGVDTSEGKHVYIQDNRVLGIHPIL